MMCKILPMEIKYNVARKKCGGCGSLVNFLFVTLICVFTSGIFAKLDDKPIRCPGLDLTDRWGVDIHCVLTSRGVVNFNCSEPVPVETVALYSCRRYFRQTASSSPVKLMRCDEFGRWTRQEHFQNLKCEYECGKAHPLTKTLIINDRITTRTIYPWHALIYLQVDDSELDRDLFPGNQTISLPGNSSGINDPPQLIINELSRPFNLPVKRTRRSTSYEAYICGGTLITPSKILTAAHCLVNPSNGKPRDPKLFKVVLGGISNSFYTNRQDSSSQIIPAGELHISSAFKYEQFEGDIGIISLKRNAQLSNVISPACLPLNIDDSRLFISNGKYGEVIGSRPEIARTASGSLGLGLSTQLKSKRLHVLPTIDCSRNIDRFPSDKEYCAGRSDEVICSGDSGGGMVSSPNFGLRRRYTIQGIVSYARARELCENYAVFTRVYKFMDWIRQVMAQNATQLS